MPNTALSMNRRTWLRLYSQLEYGGFHMDVALTTNEMIWPGPPRLSG